MDIPIGTIVQLLACAQYFHLLYFDAATALSDTGAQLHRNWFSDV